MLFDYIFRDLARLLPSYRLKQRKEYIRERCMQRRRILKEEEVSVCSAEVSEQVAATEEYRNASVVLLYYPVHNEIDLRSLCVRNPEKTFLLPVTHRRSLELRPYNGEESMQKGRYGIPEPQTPTYTGKVDLILVPGVAFDHRHNRLGRGGGYYDRFLKRYSRTPKIGVGYSFQLLDSVPHSMSDRKVNRVIVSHTK